MSKNKFKWKAHQDEGIDVCYEGENNKFVSCIELVGEDLCGNQMWYASLFSKEAGNPIPVSEYGLPFTSVYAAQEAVIKAINKAIRETSI